MCGPAAKAVPREAVPEASVSTRCHGALPSVEALTLAIRIGKDFAVAGSEGSDKTTAIRMLTAPLRPTSGGVAMAGRSIAPPAVEVRRMIGYVPQGVVGRSEIFPVV